MTKRPTRNTADGAAYLQLRALARTAGRPTIELIQLYALEGMLARIAVSHRSEDLVLKGGMLLAAYGARRPTRDLDLLARRISNEVETVRALVMELASIDLDDGLEFKTGRATAEVIREGSAYSGVRVTLAARLATAKIALPVDVNVGDPVQPPAKMVRLPRLLNTTPLRVQGYPLTMVLAEKVATAVELGEVNTRWRDFADLYTLRAETKPDGTELAASLDGVAKFRGLQLSPLRPLLVALPQVAQPRWTAWLRKQGLEDRLPTEFEDVLEAVARFVDPALTEADGTVGRTWDPATQRWESTKLPDR